MSARLKGPSVIAKSAPKTANKPTKAAQAEAAAHKSKALQKPSTSKKAKQKSGGGDSSALSEPELTQSEKAASKPRKGAGGPAKKPA